MGELDKVGWDAITMIEIDVIFKSNTSWFPKLISSICSSLAFPFPFPFIYCQFSSFLCLLSWKISNLFCPFVAVTCSEVKVGRLKTWEEICIFSWNWNCRSCIQQGGWWKIFRKGCQELCSLPFDSFPTLQESSIMWFCCLLRGSYLLDG